MKSLRLLVITVSASLMVVACQKDGGDKEKNGAEVLPQAQVAEFGYYFQGRDSADKACTTGVCNYNSHHEMCLGLQNPNINNDCAAAERIMKLDKDCPYYDYLESRICRVQLLKPNSKVSLWGEHKQQDVVKSLDLCTGYNKSGQMIKEFSIDSNFYGPIGIRASARHIPRQDYKKLDVLDPEYRDYLFKIQLEGSGNRNIEYSRGFSASHGTLFDESQNESYKYLIRCHQTWACDADFETGK